jgi:cytochrome c-type biogenesis protein CcmF
LAAALSRLWLAALAALAAAGLGQALFGGREWLGLAGFGLAAWLLVGSLTELGLRIGGGGRTSPGAMVRRALFLPRAAWGMTIAHAGLAIAIAGMTGASVWKVESIQVQAPGQSVTVAGYTYRFDGAREIRGPNYIAVEGTFTVTRDGRPVATLTPERRRYPVEGQETTEAAIRSTVLGDLYAVIGEADGDQGAHVTRIYFNPLVPWIWGGVLVMVAGGLLSLSDRRYRLGAPARKQAPATVPAAA